MDRYGPPPRRALVVTAAMGSGHVQVGKELARRLEGLGHRVRIVELTDVMAGPTGDWLAAMYPWLVQRPAVYDWVYRTFLHARQERGRRIGIPARLAERGLQAVCDAWHPDVVVTTFHVAGQALGRLRGDGRITAPVVTFVTTFGVHDGWLHPATDAYLCISPLVAAELRQRTAAPVRCPGPVVRPEFDPRLGARGIVGAARDGGGERVALLVAGSLGMGDVGRTARVVAGTAGWRPVVA